MCRYAKKRHDIDVSILIDKFDKRKWQAGTCREMMDAIYDPGFTEIFDAVAIKSKMERIIDDNAEKLKRPPSLVKEVVTVQDEYFNIVVSGSCNADGKFDCHVNNECFSAIDPFDDLQAEIDKKNKKIADYLQKCDKCFLLICLPNVSKGNYCRFSDRLKTRVFASGFAAIYLCQYDKIFTNGNFVWRLKDKTL